MQVQGDGRDLFDDTQRPVSGAAPKEATDLYIIPAGTPITTVVEADSGLPTGTANVVLETEPYRLFPQLETVVLHGRNRLRVSERRAAELANLGVGLAQPAISGRVSLRTGPQTKAEDEQKEQLAPSSGPDVGHGPGGGGPGGPPRPPVGSGPRPGGR